MKLFSLLLLFTSSAFADSYVQSLNCQAIGIALNSPSTTATVQCPNVPPPPSGICTQGQTGDITGFKALCSGPFKLKSGGGSPVTMPYGPYSYDRIFGDSWPGDRFGSSMIFTVGAKQFLSIPFKPTPGHTITLNEAQTFSTLISESVSTSPGLFNNGQVGNGVICVQALRVPSLILSSNGTQAQCALDPNKTYWFNVAPAFYANGAWSSRCTTINCDVAVTLYKQN